MDAQSDTTPTSRSRSCCAPTMAVPPGASSASSQAVAMEMGHAIPGVDVDPFARGQGSSGLARNLAPVRIHRPMESVCRPALGRDRREERSVLDERLERLVDVAPARPAVERGDLVPRPPELRLLVRGSEEDRGSGQVAYAGERVLDAPVSRDPPRVAQLA